MTRFIKSIFILLLLSIFGVIQTYAGNINLMNRVIKAVGVSGSSVTLSGSPDSTTVTSAVSTRDYPADLPATTDKVILILASEDGSADILPASVVWDASGANESFTNVAGASGCHTTDGLNCVSVWYLDSPTVKSADFTATWPEAVTVHFFTAYYLTGAASGAPEDAAIDYEAGTVSVGDVVITPTTDGAMLISASTAELSRGISSYGSGQENTTIDTSGGFDATCSTETKATAAADTQTFTFAGTGTRRVTASIAIAPSP